LPLADLPSNTTIRRHLESGSLESRTVADEEVAAFWQKAVVAYDDARLAGSSLEARFLRAYDAGRIAAFAIVRSAGYRTRGGDGHHYVTFDVARSLVDDPDLRRALDEMSAIRSLRHDVNTSPTTTSTSRRWRPQCGSPRGSSTVARTTCAHCIRR
jgi:hypothetical protein